MSTAIACAVLVWSPAQAIAQDKPQTVEDYQKRLKEQADKMGLKSMQPVAPSPPAAASGSDAPPPAPGNVSKSPQPGASPAAPPAKPTPAIAQPGPGGKPIPAPTPTPPNIIKGAPTPPPGAPMPRPGVPGAPAGAKMPSPSDIPAGASSFGDDGKWHFDLVADVPLVTLIELVREDFGYQLIFMDNGLAGQTVYISSPIALDPGDVLPFITMLLEQRDYTIVQDSSGIFLVQPKADTKAQAPREGGWTTTRIIHTPNIKPTSLQQSIQSLIASGRAGQPAAQPIYMDDLGLIIMTDTPRTLKLVEDFVKTVVDERAALKFYRFELRNIAAASAKDRVLELLGQQAQRVGASSIPGAPGAVAQPVAAVGGPGGAITNLNERLTVDPTSNSLFLRGRDDEQKLLEDMLAVVDVPNAMVSRWYATGYKTALAVAAQGKAEQLGAVTEFDFGQSGSSGGGGLAGGPLGNAGGRGLGGAGNSQTDTVSATAGFVLYPSAGGFIYRGTDVQHERVAALIKDLQGISSDEVISFEFYKLKHGKAADVADIIQNLLSNTAGTGNRSGGLLGRDLGSRNNSRTTPGQPRTPQPAAGTRAGPGGTNGTGGTSGPSGGLADLEGADVFVLADEPNNQILVKAPAKLQPQFRELIGKIDLRRPQVYIDAKIVVINETDDIRLAIEVQQIIGQFALNTNFGLGSLTTGSGTMTTGNFLSPKSVNTSLSGITSALVRSKDVPFIINAVANNADTRIVASPQLLVDDNEEAEVSVLDQQPTGTTSQSGNAGSTITGFQGFESAGPKLKIKPQISEGGYLRIEYEVELSAFNGSAAGNLPPPKLENKISSKSVTVPTDATIIVGGLTFEQTGHTVVKVPLLGDIPLIGNLFKDQSKSGRKSTLYTFITPKIMRDPSFADLRLMTKAPLAKVHIESEYPPPEAEAIPVIDSARYAEEARLKGDAQKHRDPQSVSPAQGAPVRHEPPSRDEP